MDLNWNAIGAIGEMLGAVGVIASLLYLAIQVKGDREATGANTIQMRATAAREAQLAVATSDHLAPILASVYRDGSWPQLRGVMTDQLGLDDEAATRLHAYWQMIIRQAEGTFRMPMTDSEREELLRGMASTVLTGPMEIWWDAAKKTVAGHDFVTSIDRRRESHA